MRTVSKQKIKLVSGRSHSFADKAGVEHARKSCDENAPAQTGGAELAVLMEKFLVPVLKATGASAGAIRVLTPNHRGLQMIASTGLPVDIAASESLVDSSCGVCGKAVGGNSMCAASDLAVCVRRCGTAFFNEACKHVVAVPLMQPDLNAAPAGVLTLFFESAKEMQLDDARILGAYAELISAALDNEKKHAENRRVSLLAERQSIANEIHDSLAQTLYFAKMRSSLLLEAMRTKNELLAFKCARDIDESLDSGQKSVRELVTHFRCQMDTEGLQHALQKLARDFFERTDIPLEYINRVAEMNLPLEHELQVFLIVREALVNIGSHSGATTANLTVDRSDGRYEIVVKDNGSGGCSNTPLAGHYGLTIMRERAARIGGEVQVESFEGLGTCVRLSFSIPAA